MATFEVKVLPIKIEAHPGADSLEIARIGDYRSIVRLGDFKDGDLVAYIPEGSVCPGALIEQMGLTGRLAGADKNRVKAVRLRGVCSQGLCLKAREGWLEGQDVAEELGIHKYEPIVPAGFQGELMSVGGNRTLHYDIENVKKFPEVFKDGEEVVICEKIHGSNCQINIMSDSQRLNDTEDDDAFLIIASKGVGAKGLAFKIHAEANKNNLYVKTAMRLNLVEGCYNAFGTEESVFVIGEIYGKGVQDLTYGLTEPEFRIFDIYLGNPGEGRFLGDVELDKACKKLVIPRVPVLYRGPFSKEVLDIWTNGKETVSGQSSHVREGVVVRTSEERLAGADLPCQDRCQLKSVSEGYLLRKSENATEYA